MNTRSSGESALMNKLARQERQVESPLSETLRAVLLALLLLVAWSSTFIFYGSPDRISVVVGEPSPRDIKAPKKLVYNSQIKTQEARLAAAARVKEIYSDPDMKIVNQQLRRMNEIIDYMTAIRHDIFVEREQKAILTREIPELNIPTDILLKAYDLDEGAWQAIIPETQQVLETILREEIRSDQLAEKKRRITLLISHTLTDDQEVVVTTLVQNLIVANRFYDQERTLKEQESAMNAVEPVSWTIHEGESILREGEIVTDLALEKLQVLGLLESGRSWQDIVAYTLFCTLLVVALSIYVAKSQSLLLKRPRRQWLFVLTMIVAGVAARLTIPGHTLIPYLFPAAMVSILITILLDPHLGVMVSVIMAILVGYNAGGSIELTIYALMAGVVGSLAMWRMEQLGSFVRVIVYMTLVNIAVILAFRLQSRVYDAVGMLQLVIVGVANAILSSSLAFVAFAFIGRIFGITTSLQLLELARPTHPLFKQLLTKAPGTYHHSIVISNMAERAATVIGADALLARVGSYYHDIGKVTQPYFFAENQTDGENPHDKLDPKTSAEIIIGHTIDGLSLARKHGLPDRVCDFIPEHHGTTLVTYFYRRANQNNDEVHEQDYRYPGPKPQSKETAIVMLADSIEAWVRANRPATQAEMERVIRQVINDRLVSGQLDECNLTLHDLDQIREAFISVLQGIFHPRIQYPDKIDRKNTRSAAIGASNGK